ncbi:MAG: hypothetical protein KJ607_14180, partial [Bacteroidetes bacterium]|nr:hypothetical protein [Bacteroidota bacterium]
MEGWNNGTIGNSPNIPLFHFSNRFLKNFFEYFLVAIISLLFFSYYQYQTEYIPGTDGYYHIKIAYLMRRLGFISEFKWAHFSLWNEHFSDKEFLYHIYLIPFTFFSDLTTGAKLGTVVLAGAGLTSFYAVLKLNRIKYAWFWLFLLCASGGYFLYRANVPRPQVLSIFLLIWAVHFILNKKKILLAILCFIYTYSYTAYHLPLVLAAIVYFYQLIFEKENDWKTPVTALCAIIAGMLLSPFFPNNLTMFYLQNFYILWKGTGGGPDLHMAGEFSPMSTYNMLVVNMAVLIPYFAAFFTALFSPEKTGKTAKALFWLSLSLIILTFLSKRFAEYSVPVTLLFCAFFFSPYLENLSVRKSLKPLKGKLFALLFIAGMAFLFINSHINLIPEFSNVKPPGLRGAALYLLEHTDDDELVFTADWDDAPELFYFNHKNRYFVFLDPNFMYFYNNRIWEKWDSLSNGRMGNKTCEMLKSDFGIRYGVATSDFSGLRQIIAKDPKAEIVYKDSYAYVFRIN